MVPVVYEGGESEAKGELLQKNNQKGMRKKHMLLLIVVEHFHFIYFFHCLISSVLGSLSWSYNLQYLL